MFNSLAALSTSACVAVSLATNVFAFANSAFAASIVEAVLSFEAAFSIAASKREIAELKLALFAFSATTLFSLFSLFSLFALAVATSSVAGVFVVTSSAA